MEYSSLITPAAETLSTVTGCTFDEALKHVEKTVFNTECSLNDFFAGIFNLSDVQKEKGNIKAMRRDFWKKPGDVQMMLWLGMTSEEYEEFKALRKSDVPEERLAYISDQMMFWDEADKWQRRHYNRLNECGIWWDKYTLGFYGILTKQQKRERHWKNNLRQELSDEGIRPLRIHG